MNKILKIGEELIIHFRLHSSKINQSIVIMGWISSKRDHGNVLFIQLRDKFGDTQVVVKKGSKFRK